MLKTLAVVAVALVAYEAFGNKVGIKKHVMAIAAKIPGAGA